MNVQEAGLRTIDERSEQLLNRGPSFQERTAAVAAAAAADAEEVDAKARFPKAAIDAARERKLLGAQIPVEFGGFGASIFDITEMCYTLGRACSSAAMIFAMHQTKVACLVRHGTGSRYHEALMRRVASRAVAAGLLDHRRPATAATSAPAPPRSRPTTPRSRSSATPP